MLQRFANLFRGLKRAHGTFKITGKDETKNKVTGRAISVQAEPTLNKFKMHLEGKQGIGIVPINEDNECYFGAIDIDIYEGLGIAKLHEDLRNYNLPLIPCTTKSGGIHLYLFCAEPVSAKIIYDRLSEWAVLLGYPGVEIFPKQVMLASEEDMGNWINMPYFDSNKTNRYALASNNEEISLANFLDYAEKVSQTRIDLENFKVPEDEMLKGAPPCLQVLSKRGFPEGTRNKALFNIMIYLKFRYDENFEEHYDKYNLQYLNPPLSAKEVLTCSRSVKKKTYFYTCKDSVLKEVCNKRSCVNAKYGLTVTEDEINVAIDSLTKIGTSPPSWYISVNGKRMHCESTEDLLSQQKFQLKCVDTLHLFPRNIKASTWRNMISELLENVDIIEAPEDATDKVVIDNFMSSFVEERLIRNSNKEDDLLMGRPILKEDQLFFRPADFVSYAIRQGSGHMSSRKLFTLLQEESIKVTKHNIRIKGKQTRCWSIPVPTLQTDAFEADASF